MRRMQGVAAVGEETGGMQVKRKGLAETVSDDLRILIGTMICDVTRTPCDIIGPCDCLECTVAKNTAETVRKLLSKEMTVYTFLTAGTALRGLLDVARCTNMPRMHCCERAPLDPYDDGCECQSCKAWGRLNAAKALTNAE